jgi:curli biogenesis system outer membrane secretion channel CsgG
VFSRFYTLYYDGSKNMKYTGLFKYAAISTLVFSSCSVSSVAIRHDALQSVRSVGIVPFERIADAPEAIVTQSEEAFKAALLRSGISVVERKRIADILRENEFSLATMPFNDRTLQLMGADALLAGQITAFGMESRPIEYQGYDRDSMGFDITETTDPATGGKVPLEKKLIRTLEHTVHFKIVVRLIAVSTGETVLVLENAVTSRTFLETDSGVFRTTSAGFAGDILKAMGSDLEKAIKESLRSRRDTSK